MMAEGSVIAAALATLTKWGRVDKTTFTACQARIETSRGLPFSQRMVVHLQKDGNVTVTPVKEKAPEKPKRKRSSKRSATRARSKASGPIRLP